MSAGPHSELAPTRCAGWDRVPALLTPPTPRGPSHHNVHGQAPTCPAPPCSSAPVTCCASLLISARYITSIMEAHKAREIENDKLFERKMVKEAEAEAHLYGDKEKFMTSAYRRKLDARQEYEAELKRKDEEDEKRDVTKRADLSGFYSNLLHGTLAGDVKAKASRDAAIAGCSGAAASAAAAEANPAAPNAAVAGEDQMTDPEASAEEEEDAAVAAPPGEGGGGGNGGGAGGGGGKLVEAGLADAIAAATKVQLPKREAEPEAAATVSYARRNDGEAVQSARERYLQRKMQKMAEG